MSKQTPFDISPVLPAFEIQPSTPAFEIQLRTRPVLVVGMSAETFALFDDIDAMIDGNDALIDQP